MEFDEQELHYILAALQLMLNHAREMESDDKKLEYIEAYEALYVRIRTHLGD